VTDGDRLLGRLQEHTDPAMFVFTAAAGDEASGCLAGFGSQVSIDPPRLLACVSKANHTFGVAERAEAVVVHVLPADAHDLAVLFGHETADEVDKLAQVAWRPGPGGSPVLERCPTWIGGPVVDRVDLGDHVGMLVEVTEGEVPDVAAEPLRFHQVDDVDPGHDP
jgi:flavin reductase (DIM6/NTAB) family NADH-FMN oxidoreductase RutF